MGTRHARLIDAQESCELVGVCDTDRGQRNLAVELGVPFHESVDKILSCERPDGVIIAIPHAHNLQVVEQCAKASVHVLVEKPIAGELAEAEAIVSVTRDAGVRTLVGHHRRYNPLIEEAKTVVRDGTIGRLVAVSMLWTLYKPDDYFEVEWRSQPEGGGPTFINLIHELDTLRFICGEVQRVYAESSSAARGFPVEDSVSMTLTFESGALGSIVASDATPAPWSYEATTGENPLYFRTDESCYHFVGTRGSLGFPRMELWRYPDGQPRGWQHPQEKSRRNVLDTDPLVVQLKHFCRVVREEERPLIDAADGTTSLRLALAALESMKSGKPVDLS